jgi:predicted alpha/beta-hydrolase family hydrolase
MSADESDPRLEIECPRGTTSAMLERAEDPTGTLLVHAHGAGGNMDHRTTKLLSSLLAARGVDVLRFNFLYREEGRARPDRMPVLQETLRAVVETAERELSPGRLLLGGQSMGGRTASMMAADGFPCAGLVLFAYPLHPAGKPEKLRDEHLPRIAVPTLCLCGTRDNLCRCELMEEVVARLPETFAMHWIEGADHGFHVLKRSGRTDLEVFEEAADRVAAWATELPAIRG